MKCILPQRLRAIDDSEKALRRQSILNAALDLYRQAPNTLPSVINIAKQAGLAKGTVYLYFKTKEEIFLQLLSDEYDSLLKGLRTTVEACERKEQLIPALLSGLSGFLKQQPLFMPLASMASSVLEQNVPIEIVRDFKLMLIHHLDELDAQFLQFYPSASEGEFSRLILQTHAMLMGLWQMQNWPEKLKEMMAEAPYNKISPKFEEELLVALANLWRGALPVS